MQINYLNILKFDIEKINKIAREEIVKTIRRNCI